MAFGFPAYHTEAFSTANDASSRERICAAIGALGWKLGHQTASTISATTNINLWSFGEQIEIQFFEGGANVSSRCSLPTQCIDWGKNSANVRAFLAALSRHAT